jgi:hypothetical protein
VTAPWLQTLNGNSAAVLALDGGPLVGAPGHTTPLETVALVAVFILASEPRPRAALRAALASRAA